MPTRHGNYGNPDLSALDLDREDMDMTLEDATEEQPVAAVSEDDMPHSQTSSHDTDATADDDDGAVSHKRKTGSHKKRRRSHPRVWSPPPLLPARGVPPAAAAASGEQQPHTVELAMNACMVTLSIPMEIGKTNFTALLCQCNLHMLWCLAHELPYAQLTKSARRSILRLIVPAMKHIQKYQAVSEFRKQCSGITQTMLVFYGLVYQVLDLNKLLMLTPELRIKYRLEPLITALQLAHPDIEKHQPGFVSLNAFKDPATLGPNLSSALKVGGGNKAFVQ